MITPVPEVTAGWEECHLFGTVMMFGPIIRPTSSDKNFGWTLIIGGVFLYFMGINPLAIVGGGTPLKQSDTATKSREITDREGRFIATVLRDTEVVWSEIFKELGDRYQEPKLVLFKGGTHSACALHLLRLAHSTVQQTRKSI